MMPLPMLLCQQLSSAAGTPGMPVPGLPALKFRAHWLEQEVAIIRDGWNAVPCNAGMCSLCCAVSEGA